MSWTRGGPRSPPGSSVFLPRLGWRMCYWFQQYGLSPRLGLEEGFEVGLAVHLGRYRGGTRKWGEESVRQHRVIWGLAFGHHDGLAFESEKRPLYLRVHSVGWTMYLGR